MTEQELSAYLVSCQWSFAKTAKESNPHEYTLLKNTAPEKFYTAVREIRAKGTTEYFWKKPYVIWRNRGFKYWTMGAPVPETILINRTRDWEFYDTIAGQYDEMFAGEEAQNKRLSELINLTGSVLDVGCGTGILIDLKNVSQSEYFGIDPSPVMLEKLSIKYPFHKTARESFELTKRKADSIVMLYGTGSYIMPQYMDKVKQFKRAFLMFYADDYKPVTHQKTGNDFLYFVYSMKGLQGFFPGYKVFRFDTYFVVEK